MILGFPYFFQVFSSLRFFHAFQSKNSKTKVFQVPGLSAANEQKFSKTKQVNNERIATDQAEKNFLAFY